MPNNNLGADELVMQTQHKRAFIQFGGPRPGNEVQYYGQDAQYMVIQGVSNPEIGGIDPVFVPDPTNPTRYRLVARSISPQDLPEATILMREKHGSIPRQLLRIGCQFNVYEPTGPCTQLSDFLGGWRDYVQIYSGGLVTDKDEGDRTAFDSDDPIEDSLTVTFSYIYPIGALGFGEQAATAVDREVLDAVFASGLVCADCNNGDKWVYAVTKSSGAGSPGLPAELVYSVNGGTTWSQVAINGLSASEDPTAVEVAGTYLMVVTAIGYYVATLNVETGVPGTFTKFTLANLNDMFSSNPRETYIVGNSGNIYRVTDPLAGPVAILSGATAEHLLRIHGLEETLVAVGTNGTILKSSNRGFTWASTTTSPVGAGTNLVAVAVLDSRRYWVGTNFGRIYYTLNGGETWSEFTFDRSGTGAIYDIVFASQEVGYFTHSDSTPTARIYCTWNGGKSWTNGKPRIQNLPTFNKAGRLAVPATDDPGWASNMLVVAGLAGGGTDGILLVGYASRL